MKTKTKGTQQPPRQSEPSHLHETAPSENPEHGYSDALSTTTREERRNLLISNVVIAAFVWGSLIPTKVEALGISLESSERLYLLILMFGVNLYFLVAFWLYSRVDERVWLISYGEAEAKMWKAYSPANQNPEQKGRAFKLGGSSNDLPEEFDADPEIFFRAWKTGQRVYHHRLTFDIYFPIALTILIWIACITKLIVRGT